MRSDGVVLSPDLFVVNVWPVMSVRNAEVIMRDCPNLVDHTIHL